MAPEFADCIALITRIGPEVQICHDPQAVVHTRNGILTGLQEALWKFHLLNFFPQHSDSI